MPPQQREIALSTTKDAAEAPILQASRHLLKSNGSILGSEVAEVIGPLFPTFDSAIPKDLRPALASIDGRQAISHGRIYDFIQSFGPILHTLGFGRGQRIAVVLPNGPELALCIVTVATWASCVPLSANGVASELEHDLQRCGADLVIGPCPDAVFEPLSSRDERFCVLANNETDYKGFASIEESANKLGIPFVGLVPSSTEAGIFRLSLPKANKLRKGKVDTCKNTGNNEVLVLFTSGTTGNKKLVPHQLSPMLTAATTIALSWNLTSDDVNCNLMPLFHGTWK